MEKKRFVLPGDHLFSSEEAVSGENTYEENDEIFSAGFGEGRLSGGAAEVAGKGRKFIKPSEGMEMYCLIIKTSPNKAVASCIPVSEAEKPGSTKDITAVLPVTGLGKKEYVRDLRDEVKIGDIIKAKVSKVTKTGVDITIAGPGLGFLCVFCPKCRNRMDLKDNFICNACGWKERRKTPRE